MNNLLKTYLTSLVTPILLYLAIFQNQQWAENIFVFLQFVILIIGIIITIALASIKDMVGDEKAKMIITIKQSKENYLQIEKWYPRNISNFLSFIYICLVIGSGWIFTGIIFCINWELFRELRIKLLKFSEDQ